MYAYLLYIHSRLNVDRINKACEIGLCTKCWMKSCSMFNVCMIHAILSKLLWSCLVCLLQSILFCSPSRSTNQTFPVQHHIIVGIKAGVSSKKIFSLILLVFFILYIHFLLSFFFSSVIYYMNFKLKRDNALSDIIMLQNNDTILCSSPQHKTGGVLHEK